MKKILLCIISLCLFGSVLAYEPIAADEILLNTIYHAFDRVAEKDATKGGEYVIRLTTMGELFAEKNPRFAYIFSSIAEHISQTLGSVAATGEEDIYLSSYKITDGKVFFGDAELVGANVDTFEVLNGGGCRVGRGNVFYAKDKANVYFQGEKVAGADPSTFALIDSEYAKDDNYVYYRGELQGEISNTRLLSGGYLFKNGGIYCPWDGFTQIEDVDVATFKVSTRRFGYDKANAYVACSAIENLTPATDYQVWLIENPRMDIGYMKNNGKIFYFSGIPNALVDKDVQELRNERTEVELADSESFEKIDGVDKIDARDRNHNYKDGQIVD